MKREDGKTSDLNKKASVILWSFTFFDRIEQKDEEKSLLFFYYTTLIIIITTTTIGSNR